MINQQGISPPFPKQAGPRFSAYHFNWHLDFLEFDHSDPLPID
jgi:hypothetical protein